MARCLISLGANLGETGLKLDQAISLLESSGEIMVREKSRYFETLPVGGPTGQPKYLNAAVIVETSLKPLALLHQLQEIENRLGRTRSERWGPRTIDLDMLLYDDLSVDLPELKLPHPRISWRRFVLEPAAEIAADMVDPATGWTIGQLWENLNRLENPYIAIAGGIGAGKTELARELARDGQIDWVAEQFDAGRLAQFYADPSATAPEVELEFLRERAQLLEASVLGLSRPVVTDFWFEQSAAFARSWLSDEQFGPFMDTFEVCRKKVVQPTLVAFLDRRPELLLSRISLRGRPFELNLQLEQLERIDKYLRELLDNYRFGPVLILQEDEPESLARELTVVIESMKAG
jgi:2-amino-4-hydroxy-6-hydroxymethyldihydropteridine diphosphokinase